MERTSRWWYPKGMEGTRTENCAFVWSILRLYQLSRDSNRLENEEKGTVELIRDSYCMIKCTSMLLQHYNLTQMFNPFMHRAYPRVSLRREQASITVSLGAKALRRRYPSPPGPNPAPGIVTTCAFSKISEKVSQLLLPSGSFTKT